MEGEERIYEACLHVNQARAQRLLCSQMIKAAEKDALANLPHSKTSRCLVMDFSQNAGLPQFGDSQAGPTYYYSPVNVNIFGIVDASVKGGALDAYVYHEGQGAKGGNNVASMLMLYLKRRGWLKRDEPGKELTIIMDNCVGQNKNNMVLRLANLLVECKFFFDVYFAFYIAGHTKNLCDRW